MPGSELIGAEELRQLQEVVQVKNLFRYNTGYKVKEFEEKCAKFIGVPYALGVSNGTSAISVALHALGIRPGDEVIIPAFTFVATQEAVEQIGAIPVIVDVDETLSIDPNRILEAITTRTKAIIAVHMMGSSADMESICDIANNRNLIVMEDSCQSFGSKYRGMMCGSIGDMAVFSFAFTKTITTGEGGLVVTHHKQNYLNASMYHDHGHEHLPIYRGLDIRNRHGFNYRMSELNGAVGVAQISKIELILSSMENNYKLIREQIRDYKPEYRRHNDESGSIKDSLVFRFKSEYEAYDFAESLRSNGIFQKILPCALRWHLLDMGKGDILRRHVAIPININMDIDKTVQSIRTAYEKIA